MLNVDNNVFTYVYELKSDSLYARLTMVHNFKRCSKPIHVRTGYHCRKKDCDKKQTVTCVQYKPDDLLFVKKRVQVKTSRTTVTAM